MSASTKTRTGAQRKPGQERITSPSKIVALLSQLKLEHELLSVSMAGCEHTANTVVLGIRTDSGALYLDELSTENAHRVLLRQRKARFSARLQGMKLYFDAVVRKVEKSKGIALYEMALPQSITRLQRRDSFRLRLTSGTPVPLNIEELDGESVGGAVQDLSASGLGALLRTRKQPCCGQLLSAVTLSLPGKTPITTRLEVRFARSDDARGMLHLGGRFVDLTPRQQRDIAQYIAEQQRKRRRHRPH